MELQQRLDLLVRLGEYMLSEDSNWKNAKKRASCENGWFIPSFIELASYNIANQFLNRDKLTGWVKEYSINERNEKPLTVGIVMAGNIPMVGFHDFLCGFVSGHRLKIKMSSKDNVLLSHLIEILRKWNPDSGEVLFLSDMLKGCDAYIATGSNNSSRYFKYYFAKYPHLIRHNRTSIAILSGNESENQLMELADDIYQFFGLGCRNVTKLYVPIHYNFEQLLSAFNKYKHVADHHKYKNNYDYQLAILIVNKLYYMTNGSIIMVEDPAVFSPISRLHYQFYSDRDAVLEKINSNPDIQCAVGEGLISFGKSQQPALNNYADGVNTLQFFLGLC